jgi:Uma2 family endonuclease
MTLRPPYKPITAEFYRQLPEGPPYYQLIQGKLIMSPSLTFYHQRILLRLGHYIETYLEKHDIGEIVPAPSDVFLDEINVFQPDLYFVRNDRRRFIVKEGVEGAPTLVIEVLSPSTSKQDRTEKREAYMAAGVEELWLIDPKAQTIEAHLLEKSPDAQPKITQKPGKFTSAIFPGLRVDTTKLFKPVV